MATRPDLKVYIVEEPRDANAKPYWHEVGAGWSHKDGPGANLFITAGMSVTGKLVVVENKAQQEPTVDRSQTSGTTRRSPGREPGPQ